MSLPIDEEWRPVPGYEGRYEASTFGQVRSIPRPRTKGGILRGTSDGKYLHVVLYGEGRSHTVTVHSVVCATFHGPRPAPATEVRHLDGDATNNRSDNLAWGTRSENSEDSRRHGTHPTACKTVCKFGHSLTDPDNVHIDPLGKRRCRSCNRERHQRRAAPGRCPECRRPLTRSAIRRHLREVHKLSRSAVTAALGATGGAR